MFEIMHIVVDVILDSVRTQIMKKKMFLTDIFTEHVKEFLYFACAFLQC